MIGQIEGHVEAPQGQKTTKYEHVIPQLVAVQEDPAVEGLLVLINTVGGERSSRTHRLSISVHPASVPVGNRSGLGLQAQNSHFTVKNDKIRFAFMNHA